MNNKNGFGLTETEKPDYMGLLCTESGRLVSEKIKDGGQRRIAAGLHLIENGSEA